MCEVYGLIECLIGLLSMLFGGSKWIHSLHNRDVYWLPTREGDGVYFMYYRYEEIYWEGEMANHEKSTPWGGGKEHCLPAKHLSMQWICRKVHFLSFLDPLLIFIIPA